MTLYSAQLSVIRIGNLRVPGIVKSIEIPEREINWQVQQGVSGIGAATIYRGLKLIESIKIVTLLGIPGQPQTTWDQAVSLWDEFLAQLYPNPAIKPPAFAVDHPLFARLRPKLTTVALKTNGVVPGNEAQTVWNGVLTLIEYRPLKLATPGPPDPAKLDSRDKPPADAVEKELEELLNKAASL